MNPKTGKGDISRVPKKTFKKVQKGVISWHWHIEKGYWFCSLAVWHWDSIDNGLLEIGYY